MKTYVGELDIKDVAHPAKVQKRLLSILRREGIDGSGYPIGQLVKNEIEEEVQQDLS